MKTNIIKLSSLLCLVMILSIVPISLNGLHFARWFTSMGDFTATLRDEIVPITAGNFITLTNSGFYDSLHFHRVVAGFVIQDGDPLGTGYGGPGYTIPDEFSPLLHHDSAGVLAMAKTSLPNSAGSQYYITLAPTPHLDGNYAIFGKVFEGLDVVMAIGQVPVDINDHPINNVYIDSLRILDMIIYNVAPNPDSLVQVADGSPQTFVVEAFNNDLTVVFEWYIDDVLQPQFTDLMMEPVFQSYGMHTVKCVTSTYQVSWTTIWQVEFQGLANDDEIAPPPCLKIVSLAPNPFHDSTKLSFSLDKNSTVQIMVYDCKGRLMHKSAVNGKTGHNSLTIDSSSSTGPLWTNGVYLIKLKTADHTTVQKAVFIK